MSGSRCLPASVGWIAGLAGAVGLAALAVQLAPTFALAEGGTPAAAAPAAGPAAAPMSDAEWKKNSGSGAVPERYQIIKGDTLWGISKRFFGDGMAWPKLYESNKDTISNPNLIYPNKWIVFVPGTGTSLPKLADQQSPSQTSATPADPSSPDSLAETLPQKVSKKSADRSDSISSGSAKERSDDWRTLPKQAWEISTTTLPATSDALGFDKTAKLQYSKAKGFQLEAFAATDRITTLGQIVGGRSGAEYLSLGDTVYIRADEDIQLGETYAVTQEPAILKSRKSDRQGYSYAVLGKVKIIGVRDDLFVGTVVSGHDLIYRGNDIIVAPPDVPVIDPIPAAIATEGVLMMDKHYSTFYTAQHKLIFVDRGAADGVKVGNIFRAYEHYDLSNDKKITSSDFIIDADAMVVQVSDRFCVATIINSIVPVTENSSAVLLTDVSDLGSNKGFRGPPTAGGKQGPDELDELDKLDNSGGMGKDEQKELQQLEKWKGNPQGQPTPGAAPGAPPANSNEEVAPPPPPPPAGEPKAEELAPPPPAPAAPESPPPPPPSDGGNASPPPPPPTEEAPPAPAAPAKSAPVKISPAPAAPSAPPPPPSAPPPAPGGGGSAAPTDESKALDQLLNQ